MKYLLILFLLITQTSFSRWFVISKRPMIWKDYCERTHPLTTYSVSSAADVAALPTLNAGDVVQATSTTWTDQHVTFTGTGTANNPIYFRAAVDGSTIFTGDSWLLISGSYIIVEGILAQNGNPIAVSQFSYVFETSSTSSNIRIYNCKITNYNPTVPIVNANYVYIKWQGGQQKIDHCYFSEKTSNGTLIDGDVPNNASYDSVLYCYFGHRAHQSGGSAEQIRIGCCESKYTIESHTFIGYNWFEGCSGEQEIVSFKTSFCTAFGNVIHNSQGLISIRQGHSSRIEQNWFLGDVDSSHSGVGFYGIGHHIVNNYFSKQNGSAFQPAAFQANGQYNLYCTDLLFQQIKGCYVDSNTFYKCNPNLIFGYFFAGEDPAQNQAPLSITYRGNLFPDCNGAKVDSIITEPIVISGNSNYYYNGTIQNGTRVNFNNYFTLLNQNLVADGNGYYRISNSSPALVTALDTRTDLIYSRTSTINPIAKASVGTTF